MPLDQDHELEDTATMSFGEHLEELRRRIILALVFPIPLFFIFWPFSDELLALIIDPLSAALTRRGLDDRLQVLSPPEALLTQIKITFLAAIIISAPWMLWQAWQFIRPGLYQRERRFVYLLIPGSAILTALGILVLYYIMLPLVLIVLVNFGANLDRTPTLEEWRKGPHAAEIDPSFDPAILPSIPILAAPPEHLELGMMWMTPDYELIIIVPKGRYDPAKPRVDENGNPLPLELDYRRIPLLKSSQIAQQFRLTTYVNFVLLLALGMVVAFQTPLVLVLLGWLNLASADWLAAHRKHALMVTAILGAILTPADPWSMFAMWIPLYLLFEFGIIMMRLLPAKRVAEGGFLRRWKREKDTGEGS